MQKKNTDDLKQEITKTTDLGRFLNENRDNFISIDVSTALTRLFERQNLPKAQVARDAYISEVYLHQLFSGKRKPSRNRLICVYVTLGASLEEIQELLHHCCFAQLYAHNQRDAIIMYGIVHTLSLQEINNALFKEELESLF